MRDWRSGPGGGAAGSAQRAGTSLLRTSASRAGSAVERSKVGGSLCVTKGSIAQEHSSDSS